MVADSNREMDHSARATPRAFSITLIYGEPATDMALQQVSLSGVIICPDQELEQRFAVNSFTVASFHIIIADSMQVGYALFPRDQTVT
jgi:hypothetical protein